MLRKNLFTHVERENGKAGWLLGASFITEGAIPFAAADPLRVIPAIMLGSAVTGGLSELFAFCTLLLGLAEDAARKGWRHIRWFVISAFRFYNKHGWRWF